MKKDTGKSRVAYSSKYLAWVNETGSHNLTSVQHRFAEWLLTEDNSKVISQVGDLDSVFLSIRAWLKSESNKSEKLKL